MGDDRAYRFQLQYVPEDEGYFVAQVPELDLSVRSETRAQALQLLEDEVEAAFERAAQDGEKLPDPADRVTEPGRIEVELAAPVYRDLLVHARAQDLEPADLALQLLTRSLGELEGRSRRRPRQRPEEKGEAPKPAEEDNARREAKGSRRGRGRQGRGGRREGYRPDMEDQANFLAYVRDQERGGRGRR